MTGAAAFPIPDSALESHMAFVGKTGSGKTSSCKLAVEHVVERGFRVCVLDAVKSDWWGITSSADGQSPGLPFVIAGGPRGHVGLHSEAGALIGQLVGSGKLPLSILDMADFEAGGLQRFFVAFAEALMRSMRGVLYLVVEEAHEFAPKERAGLGQETLAIHWAKKLATAGRSKGIRLVMATQRVQALHNALLGSCETLVAHRLTAPADQEPILKWLKANTDRDVQAAVAGSLSSLQKGEAWVCSGEARMFERIAFPKFATWDNTATPMADDEETTVATAPVDHLALKAMIGDAADRAAADDPKALKAEIARLHSGLVQKGPFATPDQIEAARQAGHDMGYRAGVSDGERREWRRHLEASHAEHMAALELIRADLAAETALRADKASSCPEPPETQPEAPKPAKARRQLPSDVSHGGAIGLIEAAARVHPARLTWAQVATLAGRKPRGGHFNASKKAAIDGRYLEEADGLVMATAAGLDLAGKPPLTGPIADVWSAALPQPAKKMFDAIRERRGVTLAGLASVLQMQPRGGHWNSGMATLKRNGLLREDGGRLYLAEGLG
jgi:hypothetical protein